MKKVGREPQKLETLNLFSMLRPGKEGTLNDPANRQSFLAQVDSGLTNALSSESTLHGIRVQTMFRSLVTNLDSVQLIKEEDAGECYYKLPAEILIPDFRIVTDKGDPFLIETKNHFAKDPLKRYRIRHSDVLALGRYADLTGVAFRFAIYWAALNQWTLNDPKRFAVNGDYAEIEFFRAYKESEMASLGDFAVGTLYPITLRLNADMDKPRETSPARHVTMTTGSAEITVGDVLIEDKAEKNIALYLMMYGKWNYDGAQVEFDEQGLPIAVVHQVAPENPIPDQGFEIIGSLSSLYSQVYNSLTLEQGCVSQLNVKNPASLAPIIPRHFQKKQLPLWRFILQPNHEEPKPSEEASASS
ncbi:MAG: hypothetical protein WBY53_12930 [Acidobacteriaceae bacterium]